MPKLEDTYPELVQKILERNPNKELKMGELAELFVKEFPEVAQRKMNDSKNISTIDELVNQLQAEMSSIIRSIQAKLQWSKYIEIRSKPLRCIWHSEAGEMILSPSTAKPNTPVKNNLSESDLYPLLMDFLKKNKALNCKRINEKTSHNRSGRGGNYWLHPDIVALEALGNRWCEKVRACVDNTIDTFYLWSFEVKKELNRGNVRESFFQAVSNSSWANFGYLVASCIANEETRKELEILSGLHGIGVLLLDVDKPDNSQILIPARERSNIDWHSVNRIAQENSNFLDYIQQVSIYKSTGNLTTTAWDN